MIIYFLTNLSCYSTLFSKSKFSDIEPIIIYKEILPLKPEPLLQFYKLCKIIPSFFMVFVIHKTYFCLALNFGLILFII